MSRIVHKICIRYTAIYISSRIWSYSAWTEGNLGGLCAQGRWCGQGKIENKNNWVNDDESTKTHLKHRTVLTSFSEVPQTAHDLHSMHCQGYFLTDKIMLVVNCRQVGWPMLYSEDVKVAYNSYWIIKPSSIWQVKFLALLCKSKKVF